jgi:hypothetical protein
VSERQPIVSTRRAGGSPRTEKARVGADEQFRIVYAAIEQLIAPPTPKRTRIGFHRDDE